MARVVKFEIVDLPKLYLVGKEERFNIQDFMKGEVLVSDFWVRCYEDGTFATLERQSDFLYDPSRIGLTIDWDMGAGCFTYFCGMRFIEGVTVPEGYAVRELTGEKAGLCWIKGKDATDIHSIAHRATEQAIKDAGYVPVPTNWSMIINHHQRYTTPDENGEIILDYYMAIGRFYDSLGDRMVSPYCSAYPPFKPVLDCGASESSQRQMYNFLQDTLNIIRNDLSVIDVEYVPDDCYQYYETCNTKPDLRLKMLGIRKKFFDFYDFLFSLGLYGEPVKDKLYINKKEMRISKKFRDKLPVFGLHLEDNKDFYMLSHNKYKELFPAWKLHSSISGDYKSQAIKMVTFLNGRFGGKVYSVSEMFGRISCAESIAELEDYFVSKGFTCKNDDLMVTYEKEYPKNQRAYMRIYYDWRRITPLVFELKSPRFSEVIKSYDQMDDDLKALIFNRTKTCDGCRYCVQTDKTKTRPLLAQKLEFEGKKKMKCPLFPSFF